MTLSDAPMKNRHLPLVLFVAGLLMSQSLYAMAESPATYDDAAAGKKDNPPKPKPTRGPRGDGDDN